jgi:hypothetical protein
VALFDPLLHLKTKTLRSPLTLGTLTHGHITISQNIWILSCSVRMFMVYFAALLLYQTIKSLVSEWLGGMWKEAVLACFERLYHSLPEGTERTRESLRLFIRQAEISTWTHQIRRASRVPTTRSPHLVTSKSWDTDKQECQLLDRHIRSCVRLDLQRKGVPTAASITFGYTQVLTYE